MQQFVLRGRMSSQHWILSFHLSPWHSTGISWTSWGKRLGCTSFYLKTCPTSIWHSPDSLNNWAALRSQKIFHPCWGFQNTPTLHTNDLRVFCFFHFIQFLHFTSSHNWPCTERHEWVSVAPDYQPAWWVWALPPTHTHFRKKERGLLQMAMPFRSLSLPCNGASWLLLPRLGSVQAAAVNEVFPPLSCWGFWHSIYLASVLSACVSAWDQTRGTGKQVGPMKPGASVCRMHVVEMANMRT